MKKRNTLITTLSVVVVVALFVFIQPLQSVAVNALSVFRVQDVHSISITVTDLQQFAQSAQNLKAMAPANEQDAKDAEPNAEAADKMDSMFVTLNSPQDFTAFDLKLPGALNAEAPELKMVDVQTQTVTLDTADINETLSKLGAQTLLPDNINGAQITVQSPATAIAKYSDDVLIATQMPMLSGHDRVISALTDSFLSLPQIPEDLSAQLAAVDLTSGIVYVPVIEGFGQQTSIGGATGYLYSLADLKTLLGSLPSDLLSPNDGQNPLDELQAYDGDGSGLIWTSGGVLYILAGNQSAGGLTQIARSVR